MSWKVDVGGAAVSAVFEPPIVSATTGASTGASAGAAPAAAAGELPALFVCAHGAGGHMDDKAMLAAAAALRRSGLGVVRFNFVYREKQGKRPDPMPQLQACVAAVARHARTLLNPRRLILGGRSMGGRAASMLVAAGGIECDGLLLLAYPLHPAGEPTKLRDAHLPDIAVPVLCFNGTRDELCDPALMRKTVAPLADWTMHWLDGADHSFHVLKSSGRTDAEVLGEVSSATRAWLDDKIGIGH